MKSLWSFTALLLLVNLLVPQQIIKYKPCCYDSASRLNACAKFETQYATIMKGEACCAPRVISLRNGGTAPTLQPTVVAQYSANDDIVAPAAIAPLQFSTEVAVAVHLAFGHDAMSAPYDILTLHSRLNL